MLKKLTIASMVLIASSSIAFADTDNNMTSNTVDPSAAMTPDASNESNVTSAPKPAMHKKHKHHGKKHKHCKKHHYHNRTVANNDIAAPLASDPVVDPAPVHGYKGEAPCPACVHTTFNTGAYVGFGVGSRVNYLSAPAVYTGVEGTLFAGYSMLWDQVYGALEIFGQDSAEVNNYNQPSLGGATSSWGYGLSVIPGYLISDNVLGYLRLGVVNTRFTTGNQNTTGGQVGLGMQTALTNCWDLRGEWVYSFYNSIRIGVPRSQQFNLGLLYKFQV